jgi:gamma-glutamyltranspeptidase/glutathione hydrolase
MRRLSLVLLLFVALELSARQPVRAKRAMVIAQEPFAADVGVAVLKTAAMQSTPAVAVGFALAVTHPVRGQYRRWRIHADSLCRRPHDVP